MWKESLDSSESNPHWVLEDEDESIYLEIYWFGAEDGHWIYTLNNGEKVSSEENTISRNNIHKAKLFVIELQIQILQMQAQSGIRMIRKLGKFV